MNDATDSTTTTTSKPTQQQGQGTSQSINTSLTHNEQQPMVQQDSIFAKFVHCSNTPITLKCTLDDGRTVTGRFLCVDRLKNLVLSDVLEIRQIPIQPQQLDNTTTPATIVEAPQPQHTRITEKDVQHNDNDKFEIYERQLSQAMIPGNHLVKVEMNEHAFHERIEMI